MKCIDKKVLGFFKAYIHKMEEGTTKPLGTWNADWLKDWKKLISSSQRGSNPVYATVPQNRSGIGSIRFYERGVNMVLKIRPNHLHNLLLSTKPANYPYLTFTQVWRIIFYMRTVLSNETSAMTEIFYICLIQHGSLWTHMVTDHLRCVWFKWGIYSLILITKFKWLHVAIGYHIGHCSSRR